MPIYRFHQNNSGGFFKEPAINVFIHADSADEANSIAVMEGIYFDDDCEIDCDCCGQRWYRASEWDIVDEIEEPSEWHQSWADEDHIPVNLVIGG